MYTLVPELQFWFNKFLISAEVNKEQIPIPSAPPETFMSTDKSFIRLLFDDNWPGYENYNIYFKELDRSFWPGPVATRLSISPGSSYYVSDSTGTNLFKLEDDDINLLDKLLTYRLDSTNADISDIEFSSLKTNLSKLIFLFLDLQINGNYENYNTEELISQNLLEYCYECYVLDKMFNFISSKT